MARTSEFYVGGGCDEYCGAGNSIVTDYARRRNSPFFMHFQVHALWSALKRARDAGDALVVVGHSWGGSAVIKLFQDRDVPRPDLLVTVDPVGHAGSFGTIPGGNGFGGLWVNITATDTASELSGGNRVSNFWGRTGYRITVRADTQINSHRRHEDFSGMLRDAHFLQMVATVRANAARR